jgi:phosphoglycerate dehydrogenase-like enzyme
MRIVFSPLTFEKLGPVIDRMFSGHEVIISDPAALPETIVDADVLVTGPLEVSKDLLEKSPRLRMVHQWGVGVEGIDIGACSARGVLVCNVPSRGTGNAEGVAEIALMHMLLLSRRFGRSRESLAKRRLYSPQGVSLWRKRACVVGLGNVGKSIAGRLACMGMKITGVNRSHREDVEQWGIDRFHKLDDVASALPGCRFVIMALELNDETREIVDGRFLGTMDKDSYLINVARAELVSREALETALREGQLAGAGLDVFWNEPADPDDPLLNDPLVTITPHIGGVTDEAILGIAAHVAENVSRLERGAYPQNCLNRPAGERKV